MFHLEIRRQSYTDTTTIGELLIDGVHFCYTLEDAIRPRGVKIKGETAIPEGIFKVGVSHSPRFDRDMAIIYNQDNGYELSANDVSFKGVRIHGGNNHHHTEGCPLVAFNKVNESTIQGTAEKPLTAKIKELIEASEQDHIFIRIKNY